jgi:hypothetical protein
MSRTWTCGFAACIAALALAAPAWAEDTDLDEFTGETVAVETTAQSEDTCEHPSVARVLSSFKDDNLYFPAPGGDFEDGAQGWELEGGAEVTFGSSAFAPLGAGNRSLRLPAGSTATSPAFCVDLDYPHFRITVGQLGDKKKVKVKVSVVYPGLQKNVRRTGDVETDDKQPWKLSKKLELKPEYGRKYAGWRKVALRFEVQKAHDQADVRIDDILVDPKMRY